MRARPATPGRRGSLPRLWAWLQERDGRTDVALGALLLTLTAATLAMPEVDLSAAEAAFAVFASVGQATVVAIRRHAPVLVLAACTALMVLTVVVSGDPVASEFGVLLGVYAVALRRPPRLTWVAVALVLLTATTASLLALTVPPDLAVPSRTQAVLTQGLGLLVAVLVAMTLGLTVRGRREQVAALQERARQLALERDQREQLAAANERARMAREMHDVVAHSVAVMVTLAHGAAASLDRNPEGARAALQELSSTGRTALADTRRILGLLRDGPGAGAASGEDPVWPAANPEDIEALLHRFRQAGLPVRLVERGPELPPDLPLRHAVFRIVQEGLTNVLSHAPASTAVEVRLDRSADHVTVEVANTAGRQDPETSDSGSGLGIAGMRERAAAHRGGLEAGPTEDGWRVRAVLAHRHT